MPARYTVFALCILTALAGLFLALFEPIALIVALPALALSAVGVRDLTQTKHSILRNYPVIGHLRYVFEHVRPEFRQYFFEGDQDEQPFSREERGLVYQRAKRQEDKRPFGTTHDVYKAGYAFLTHSVAPKPPAPISDLRVTIGGSGCTQPYSCSLYNISAMSFGSLSAKAIESLNRGAKRGGFAHDTGEGSISVHHRVGGGDLVYQVASGYFGCRNADGSFSGERFAEQAADPQVKMIEIKLSQGAKPGHGGMLPAAKISREIAEARGIPMGVDCISPAAHSAFSTPLELMAFIARLRTLSNGKPVGFKLCIGHRREFLCIVRAMVETGITPDFIVVDGTEGGTGAAPLEFANHVGMPMVEGLTFVHNALRGAGLRDRVKIGAAGKIVTAFDMARALAYGADWCNSARGFMFAIGCIQAQACHTNACPVGIATQDPKRQKAIDVRDKSERVANFHNSTLHALAELASAAGLTHPSAFMPHHVMERQQDNAITEGTKAYPYLPEGFLFDPQAFPLLSDWHERWARAHAASFDEIV